jgi:hypothetical protein
MSKYRFKTREEFERDGQWNDEYDCPVGWNESGDMNHYLGQDVPIYLYESCDVGGDFTDDGWYFQSTDYVLKEEDYTGRWIKALADNPGCTSIKLGEVIQIISKPDCYVLDKTSQGYSGMAISCPLDTSKWELVEQPKDDIKLKFFPNSGAILILDCDNLKEFKKYLFDSGRTCNEAVGNPKYLAWNETSFWYPSSTGKTNYKWNQLKHFIPASSKVVPGYVRCVQALMHAKVGTVYPVVDSHHCLCEDGDTYKWDSIEFTPATKQEYDAQFLNEQDPLYICKQEYRKGMRVISACKTGIFSGEFIIDVEPKEFRNLAGKTNVVDYSFSKGYLYYNGEYAEILEEGVYDISEINTKTNKPFVNSYLENSGFTKSNSEAYNWLMDKPKPSIEFVQSVDVNLRTKKQINKFKF